MSTRKVNTPIGPVTMSLEDAEEFEAAGRDARQLGAAHARALKATVRRVSAVVCVLFGLLQVLCTWLDALAGAGPVQASLGFLWAGSCLVCGVATWRGTANPQARKDA
jgi:hypothetical protein